MGTQLPTHLIGPGSIIQVVRGFDNTTQTGTTSIPDDNTIPQSSEGTQVLSLSITPKFASSYLYVRTLTVMQNNTSGWTIQNALFRDSGTDAVSATSYSDDGGVGRHHDIPLSHRELAGSTTLTTFKLRVGNQGAGTWTLVGSSSLFSGKLGYDMVIMEVAA